MSSAVQLGICVGSGKDLLRDQRAEGTAHAGVQQFNVSRLSSAADLASRAVPAGAAPGSYIHCNTRRLS